MAFAAPLFAAAGSALSAASPYLMVAGTALSTASAYQQGRVAAAEAKGQAAMSRYNQQVAEQDARQRRLKSRFDQIRQQRRGRRIMGSLRAKLGASGALMTEGAPVALLADQASELALENALIGYEGLVESGRLKSQAEMFGMESELYRQRAKSARRAGALGAGTTLLSGFGDMYKSGMFEPKK